MSTHSIPPELSARISALESQVFELYQHLGLTVPSPGDSAAGSLPAEVRELADAGEREQAIRRALVLLGLSAQDATLRVDGYLRTKGR